MMIYIDARKKSLSTPDQTGIFWDYFTADTKYGIFFDESTGTFRMAKYTKSTSTWEDYLNFDVGTKAVVIDGGLAVESWSCPATAPYVASCDYAGRIECAQLVLNGNFAQTSGNCQIHANVWIDGDLDVEDISFHTAAIKVEQNGETLDFIGRDSAGTGTETIVSIESGYHLSADSNVRMRRLVVDTAPIYLQALTGDGAKPYLRVDQTGTGRVYYDSSSCTDKYNIRDFVVDPRPIMDMSLKIYNRVDEESGETSEEIGYIAEDMHAKLPRAVTKLNGKVLGLNPSVQIAYLTELMGRLYEYARHVAIEHNEESLFDTFFSCGDGERVLEGVQDGEYKQKYYGEHVEEPKVETYTLRPEELEAFLEFKKSMREKND